eukprot:gene6062-1502_t
MTVYILICRLPGSKASAGLCRLPGSKASAGRFGETERVAVAVTVRRSPQWCWRLYCAKIPVVGSTTIGESSVAARLSHRWRPDSVIGGGPSQSSLAARL